jgi:uncharacterized protein YndB with AHSA1/START domain
MTRITAIAEISRPVEEVFDYVTSPGNWPRWHPSSLAVSGATDHSPRVGEQVTEEFLVAGRHGTVVWTVRESLPPLRWRIDGEIVGAGSGGTVTYALAPMPSGTRFWREFAYDLPGTVARALDWLAIRRLLPDYLSPLPPQADWGEGRSIASSVAEGLIRGIRGRIR